MRRKRGVFIVIEGTDGSGKGEQFKLLVRRLARAGYDVATFDFPQYGKPSAFFVEEYLRGRYGGVKEVGPRRASLFYALDRFDVGRKIEEALRAGETVVANRYVASNMGHQGAKIKNRAERLKFFRWDHELEYGLLGIPRPDLNIILHVPAAVAYRLVARKAARKHLHGKKRDIHEASIMHLRRAERTYLEMAKTFPKDFTVVECVESGTLLSIEEIGGRVARIVLRRLTPGA